MEKERFIVNKERTKADRFGAVVFIIDPKKRIYVQKEKDLNGFTGKRPEDYSVICETRLPNEEWEDNIIRGVVEETGISENDLKDIISSEMVSWESGFVDGVWATVAVIECKDPDLFMELVKKANNADGVSPVGFVGRTDFEKLNLRLGVRNIIDKFGDVIFNFNNERTNFN